MATAPLKAREVRALAYLRETIEATGVSPTLREMGQALGFKSPPNAHWIIKSLEAKGYVKRTPGQHRSIELIPQGKVVTLQPDTHFLAARYAHKAGLTVEQATNDLLRGALSAASQEAC
jgi:SOS-response transcriptional repressor LexA